MGNDVRWWKEVEAPYDDDATGAETPGDTHAADIVGRTGEEMPEVAHDDTEEDDDRDSTP